MQFSRASFISPNEILADVTKAVGDEDYRFSSKGWYISQMQQALEELSFDTLFDEKVVELDINKNLNVEMPEGTFNIIEMYLFNGDLCNISGRKNLWHKRNYFTKGGGYLARNTGNNRDPFYTSNSFYNRKHDLRTDRITRGSNENNYYYNIHNGVIMLSEPCLSYQKLAVVLNGTGCAIGDLPIIPLFFRQAVKDYVCEVALRNRLIEEPNLSGLWKIYDKNLNKNETFGFYTGSWYLAKRRITAMNDHERESLREYLSKPTW